MRRPGSRPRLGSDPSHPGTPSRRARPVHERLLSPDEAPLSAGCPQGKAALRGRRAALRGSRAASRAAALPRWQPCAAILAALHRRPGSPAGSPAWQQGCRQGSAALPTWQPCGVAGLPCWQPCCRTTLKENCGAHISRSPGAFCSGFFYERRRRHPPEPSERPAGAPHPPTARGRLFAPLLRLRFLYLIVNPGVTLVTMVT